MPHNFSKRILWDRSFRRQNLSGADFRGADLRGCDFSNANLIGVNFTGARLGQSPSQIIVLAIAAIVTGIVFLRTIARLIFPAMGLTVEDPAWIFAAILFAVLTLAGMITAVRTVVGFSSRLGKITGTIVAILAGMLLGFLYAGVKGGNDPKAAIGGAAIAGALMLVANLSPNSLVQIVITTTGIAMTYGAAFVTWSVAILFLTTHQFFGGILLSLVTLTYLWTTLRSMALAVNQIQQAPGTTFKGADLTDAQFDPINPH
jgi:uncharacterized protein YjbI with pentapeptide repeats